MSTLSEHIILIICKESSKANKDILKVFKDYFSGVPHIPYTECLADSNNIYYILPDSCIIAKSLNKLFDFLANNLDMVIFRYATYSHIWGDDPNLLPTYVLGCYNVGGTQRFPPRITINANVVEKLKSISEDYYD